MNGSPSRITAFTINLTRPPCTCSAFSARQATEIPRLTLRLLHALLIGYSARYQSAIPLAHDWTYNRTVVVITGDVFGADTMDFLSKTKARYIAKPFDAERLKRDIKHILTQGA